MKPAHHLGAFLLGDMKYVWLLLFFAYFIFILTRGHFKIAFRQRGRERDKHQLVASHMLPDRDPKCPNGKLNPQPLGYGTMTLHSTQPHRPGCVATFM